jgi:hypothetical protein
MISLPVVPLTTTSIPHLLPSLPTIQRQTSMIRTLLLLHLGSLRLDLSGTSEGSVNLTHLDELDE